MPPCTPGCQGMTRSAAMASALAWDGPPQRARKPAVTASTWQSLEPPRSIPLLRVVIMEHFLGLIAMYKQVLYPRRLGEEALTLTVL